jgi:glycosyltransferase involved in cell wall biosynthesis
VRVVHISTFDLRGGAALAAYRLHRAMAKRSDCDSTMLVETKDSDDPDVVRANHCRSIPQRAKRRLQRWWIYRDREPYSEALSKVEIFSDDRVAGSDRISINMSDFDVVQLHWICGFLDYQRFFRALPEQVSLVWRLSDMNPFTGGCHYDGGCGRFEKMCGRCPMLKSEREDDLSRAIWARKRRALDQLSDDRLHIVALNRWMAEQVRRSSLLGRFTCSIIPNGVDLEEFRPIPSAAAKQALGIPTGRRVIAFVADSVNNVRKGFSLLLEALDLLKARQNLFLLVVGKPQDLPPLTLPSLVVGHVQAVPFLRQIYSAADLFLISSLEDNQPNTVLEAMACGTPVVGFKAGGIPEMVEEGKTGLLAPRGNVTELARAIEFLLDHEQERLEMAARARKRVEDFFARDRQVQNYLNLYSRLVAEREGKKTLGPQIAPDSMSPGHVSLRYLSRGDTVLENSQAQSILK